MASKARYKSKSSWLKGGVIAVVTLVIIYLILMIFFAKPICEFNTRENINCTNAQIFSTFLLPFHSIAFIQGTLVAVLVAFVIGALMGRTSKSKRGLF